MINGNLSAFMDSLALGMDLEVLFHGKRYFIQGWDYSNDDPKSGPHLEMFELLDNGYAGGYVFTYDGRSRGECTEAFLAAKLWDGLTFDEAEPEIEWVG